MTDTKTVKMVTQLLTINELIDGRLFKIPDYQRGYSWDKQQVNDLIKDIEHILPQNHKHYTGTLVISKTKASERYDIVDGQQRLTTLIILLKSIYDTDPNTYSDVYDTYIFRNATDYVLETNAESARFFRESILGSSNDKADIKSLKNLKKAKTIFKKWLKRKDVIVSEIYHTIVSKLGFLCFAPENTDEIGIMFEVINNRGKELSELEKIKNYFIYYATINKDAKLKHQINDSWGSILKYLSKSNVVSNQDENNFLRNCYLVFYSPNKSKSWHSYTELKKIYPADSKDNIEVKLNKIADFITFLKNAARHYAYFYCDKLFETEFDSPDGIDTAIDNKIAFSLKHLRCHPVNASVFPLYLATMKYLHSNTKEVSDLLMLIEILNFRTYVLPNPGVSRADSKQGDLFLWAHRLFNLPDYHSDNDEYEHWSFEGNYVVGNIFEVTALQLKDFTTVMCPEKVFIQSLTVDSDESIDYYQWNGLRYFLAAYEEYKMSMDSKQTWNIEKILITRNKTSKEKINDYLSKEHIWAKKSNTNYFNEKYIDKRRLGNFVLLGLGKNIDLSNKNIPEKIEQLRKKASITTMQVKELEEICANAKAQTEKNHKRKKKAYWNELGKRVIDARENKLINFALKRWALPKERLIKFDEVNSLQAQKEGRSESFYMHTNKTSQIL